MLGFLRQSQIKIKMMHGIPPEWEGYSIAGRQTQKITGPSKRDQHWTRVLSAGVGVGVRMKIIFMRGYYRFILHNSPTKISLLPGMTGTKGGMSASDHRFVHSLAANLRTDSSLSISVTARGSQTELQLRQD